VQLDGRPCGRLRLLFGYVQEDFWKALNNFILQKYLPRAGRTGTHDRARACALGGHPWWVPAVGRPGMGAEATQGRTVAAGTYHGCEHGVGEAWRQQPSVARAATATAVPPRGGGAGPLDLPRRIKR